MPPPPPPPGVKNPLDSYIRELGKWDVLLGRGTGPNEHNGNKYFRDVVDRQAEAYFAPTTTRKEKAEIIQGTINHIKMKKKGRFLKKLEKYEIRRLFGISSSSGGSGGGVAIYDLADLASQIEKTKQAFRYAYKKKEQINKDDPAKEDEDEDEDKDGGRQLKTYSKTAGCKREAPQSGSRGEISACHPSKVQNKGRKEEATVVCNSQSLSSPAGRTNVAAAASLSSSPRSILAPHLSPVSMNLLDPQMNLAMGSRGLSNIRRGDAPALDLAATLINDSRPLLGAARANESSSQLAPLLEATAGLGSAPLSSSYLIPPPWHQSQQQPLISRRGVYQSPTRNISSSSPVDNLEILLTQRRIVDDILNANAYSVAAEALLRSGGRAGGDALTLSGGGVFPRQELPQLSWPAGNNPFNPHERLYAGLLKESLSKKNHN